MNDELDAAAVDAAASVMYDRVKTVETMTFDIAYPSEQDDFRRVARAMLTAYEASSETQERLAAAERVCEAAEGLRREIDDWVLNHPDDPSYPWPGLDNALAAWRLLNEAPEP